MAWSSGDRVALLESGTTLASAKPSYGQNDTMAARAVHQWVRARLNLVLRSVAVLAVVVFEVDGGIAVELFLRV